MQAVVSFVVVGVLASASPPTHGATIDDARRLRSDLLSNYSLHLRPLLNQSRPVVVEVTLTLLSLVEINEVDQSISVNAWVNLTWRDELLTWNASDYGDIATLHLTTRQLWHPRVLFPKSMGDRDVLADKDTPLSVTSQGLASWLPGDIFKFSCPVAVRYFPFDTQECEMLILPNSYYPEEMLLQPSEVGIDNQSYSPHNEWILARAELKPLPHVLYSRLGVIFVLVRKPAFHVLNIILPVALLSLLSVLVFLLPAESGERVGFAFTSLLSISMYMSTVNSLLPRSSHPLPLVTIYLTVLLLLNVVAVVATLLSLLGHHGYLRAKPRSRPQQVSPVIELVDEKGDEAAMGPEVGKDGAEEKEKRWAAVWQRNWAALLDKFFLSFLGLSWLFCTVGFMVALWGGDGSAQGSS